MRISGIGRAMFGVSTAGLAALSLAYGNFKPLLEPFPILLPRPEIWAYGSAAILLVAGIGLLFPRTVLTGAIVIGAFGSIWAFTRARGLFLKPLDVGSWYGFCEALGPLVGVCILYGLRRRQDGSPSASAMTGDGAFRAAQMVFGAACIVYGAAHFAYASYTAAMVPAWLPSHMGFVYLTGFCHAAAGLGILVGGLPCVAATMEGIMMSLFGALVWLPTFFTHPRPAWASPTQVQISETFLNFLMAGSAFIVAASLSKDRPESLRGRQAN